MSGTQFVKPLVLIAETTCVRHVAAIKTLGWGRMFCQRRIAPFPGEAWGFDNGAFLDWQARKPFDEARFVRKLDEAQAQLSAPTLAVTPDIVGGGEESLRFSLGWRSQLDHLWPWYLAVQDGMEVRRCAEVLPLFAGIFLGGTDRFKLQAHKWCVLAHSQGKQFHYARAGTLTKLRHAVRVGADSLDSSFPLWTHQRFQRFAAQWQCEDTQHGFSWF